ncbi:MAG TPA: succinylglutamate desuccinylase/aspartoacylase family protein [Candidatus Saccharimonadales bacterium]|nr:succinylglutamate desuccinylase/aspartoacylase family protein [Candidatus Saccharimonadales bacterium]
MKPTPRILIVGAQHGTERLGPRVYRFIQRHHPEKLAYIDYLCGNPKAERQHLRFVETDLNRSYDATIPRSYEEKRAQKILERISAGTYDYVLDIHTSFTDVDRFLITARMDKTIQEIISASPFSRVVVMPPHIASSALIGHVPQAVSIEYNNVLARSHQALQEVLLLLDNLIQRQFMPQFRDIFYVEDKIPLDSDFDIDSPNFQLCPQGFYPVIAGRGVTYTHYKGFAARTKEAVVM